MLTAMLLTLSSNALYAQYGFGTNQPSRASVIEANSTNKGLLIPRVALNETTNFEPINGVGNTAQHTVNSLLVYNTATNGTAATAVTPGYYYWLKPTAGVAGRWVRLLTGSDLTANNGLTLSGTTAELGGTLNRNTIIETTGFNFNITGLPTGAVSDRVLLSGTNGQLKSIALSSVLAATTNNLSNNGVNTLTSTVNGKASSTGMVNTVSNSITGTNLTTTVNGIGSTALNLTPAITAATTNALVNNGTNTLTSTFNGVSATAAAVNTNTLTATNGNLVSTVNGIASTPAVAVLTNAVNGLSSSSGTVRLGGTLNSVTAINTGATNTLAITGLSSGLTTDNIVVADPTSGVLRQVKAVMPKFFYMPSVVFDISVIGTYTRNLYNEYINQFATPAIKSAGAVEGIPTLLASQLEYYVTYYDTNIFENLSIDQNGVLTYRVKNSSASEKTFMNIVFVVKK